MAVFILLLQMAACLGAGAALLRGLGLLRDLPAAEAWGWSFAAGFGLLGWAVFFPALAGFVSAPVLAGVLVLSAAGLVLLPRPRCPAALPAWGWVWLPALILAVVALAGLLQAVAPPVDGDTLTYHFARPKQILAEGMLLFVPRAVDGATPLLVHMTYLPVLRLGGELSLTLWSWASAMAAALTCGLVVWRWLPAAWSLAAVVVLATMPVWIYGAGSGQVEPRLALFTLPAVLAVVEARRSGHINWALLAGLLAGFYAGGKVLGVLFVAAAGLALLAHRRWLALGSAFALGAVAAGSQYYLWHWWVSGDPLFPMLYDVLGLPDTDFWTAAQTARLRAVYGGAEVPVRPSLWWMLAYPFQATFAGLPAWESSRTGLGILPVLLAPFAVAAAWRAGWRKAAAHPLVLGLAIALVFYLLWFASGTSQRVRHLVPLMPIVVAALLVAAHGLLKAWGLSRVLTAAIAATVAIQLGALALFSLPYAQRLARGEPREAFQARLVVNYALVEWINRSLAPTDKLVLNERQILYLLNVPYYYASNDFQRLVDVSVDDYPRQWRQLKALGTTHLLVSPALDDPRSINSPWSRLARRLAANNCAASLVHFDQPLMTSRTLGLIENNVTSEIFALADACDTAALGRAGPLLPAVK